MTIEFAKGLSLPDDAVTQTIAFIGRKGSGKTYSAGKLVEGMVGIGAQVIVVDPVGVYWGLRLGANGSGRGIDIPIMGGEHGDLPLEEDGGRIIANFAVQNRRSLVLDVSMFRKAARVTFVTALADELFHLMKSQRTPLHIVLEEAHKFIPQQKQKGEEKMVGAWEDIVRLGRNYGIGVTMISQRPQSINKEVLNQTECLVCHQINGFHERKAIKEWVVGQDLDVGEMVDDLPKLKAGEAYFWSPSWLDTLKKIWVRKKKTYDASSTPEVGTDYSAEAKPLATMEIANLTEAMQQSVKVAEAKDPKALRRRVAELEREVAQGSACEIDQEAANQAIRDAVTARDREWLDLIKTRNTVTVQSIKQSGAQTAASMKEEGLRLSKEITAVLMPKDNVSPPETTRRSRPVGTGPKRSRPVVPVDPNQTVLIGDLVARANGVPTGVLSGPQQKIVDAIAWWNAMGIPKPNMGQTAFRARYTPKGGSFNTYVSQLSTGGFIVRASGTMSLTPSGEREAATPDVSSGLPGLHKAILEALKGSKSTGAPHAKLLEIIVAQGEGGEMTKAELAEQAGYAVDGGTFSTYLSKLSGLGLIERQQGIISPSEVLFP